MQIERQGASFPLLTSITTNRNIFLASLFTPIIPSKQTHWMSVELCSSFLCILVMVFVVVVIYAIDTHPYDWQIVCQQNCLSKSSNTMLKHKAQWEMFNCYRLMDITESPNEQIAPTIVWCMWINWKRGTITSMTVKRCHCCLISNVYHCNPSEQCISFTSIF